MAAWPAHAAIAVVQTVSCIASASTTCTTGPVTTTSGNFFVASIGYCCDTLTGVSDSKTNTWAVAITDIVSVAAHAQQHYTSTTLGGSSHTFTLTGASALFYGTVSIQEVSGASASPLDQTATGTDASGTSHTTASTSTTSQANELLIGFGSSSINTTYTTDSGAGWTEQTNIATDVNTEGLISGSKVVSATGTYAYTFTTGSSVLTAEGISTWKAAASSTRQRCIGCGIDKKVIGE